MKRIIVTGVTGKSGKFFYEELRKNAETLNDFHFDFIVRNKEKAEKQLDAKGLNQTLQIGSLSDKKFIDGIFKMGGVIRFSILQALVILNNWWKLQSGMA